MGIRWGRVIVAGLVAGLVASILETLYGLAMRGQFEGIMKAVSRWPCNRPPWPHIWPATVHKE